MKCPGCGHSIQRRYRIGESGTCPHCGASFEVQRTGADESPGILSLIFMAAIAFFPVILTTAIANEAMTKTRPAWGAAVSAWVSGLGIGAAELFGKTVAERAPFLAALAACLVLYLLVRILARVSRRGPRLPWLPFRIFEFGYIGVAYAYLGAIAANLAWVLVSLPFSGGKRIAVPSWVPSALHDLYGRLKGPSWIPAAFTVFMALFIVASVWFAWSKWDMDRGDEARR